MKFEVSKIHTGDLTSEMTDDLVKQLVCLVQTEINWWGTSKRIGLNPLTKDVVIKDTINCELLTKAEIVKFKQELLDLIRVFEGGKADEYNLLLRDIKKKINEI